MKLKQVVVLNAVPTPGSMQADTSTLRTTEDTDVYYEGGIVYAVHQARGCTMIPVMNVRHMIPLEIPKAKGK